MAAVERDAVINFARPLAAKGTFSRGIPDPGICGWVHGAFLFVFFAEGSKATGVVMATSIVAMMAVRMIRWQWQDSSAAAVIMAG